MPWHASAWNAKRNSSRGSKHVNTPESQSSLSASPPLELSALIASLHRQTLVLERLANLLPQLVAQNQMLVKLAYEVVTEDDDGDEVPKRYMDGTRIDS